jgi:predicted nucleic acid-binding protein
MASERLLIDTSILIDHLRKTEKDKTVFYQLAPNFEFVVSAITEFEFSVGSTPPTKTSFRNALPTCLCSRLTL